MLKYGLVGFVCFVLFCSAFSFPSVEAQEPTELLFSVSLPYCYLVAKNGTVEDLNNTDFDPSDAIVETCALSLICNYSMNDFAENQSIGAIMEYFKIVTESDQKIIMQESEYFAIQKHESYFQQIYEFTMYNRDNYFDTAKMGGGGHIANNLTAGEFHAFPSISANTHTIGYPNAASELKETQRVTVTVYYLGRVIFSENTTEVLTQNNQTVQQIELEKHGEGWLYNAFIPENELSEINLLYPIPNMEPIIPEFPTGTIFLAITATTIIVMITKKRLKTC